MSITSEPIVVLYKSNMCSHCNELMKIWDTPSSKGDSVTNNIRKIYPSMRFFIVTAKDNTGRFDETTAPKELLRYAAWYPIILLIPGNKWDLAISKIGSKSNIDLLEGVQILNGMWDNNELKYVQKYDIRNPAEFGRWIKDALNNDEFRRVQSQPSSNNNIITPLPSSPLQVPSTRPILSNLIKKIDNYDPISLDTLEGDVCSMRIIPRPY